MSKFLNTITGTARYFGLMCKKYRPEILTGIGIAAGAGATVLACKATLKAADIVEDAKSELAAIEDTATRFENYTPEERKKDTIDVYRRTGTKLMKVYAPAAGLGMLSVGSHIGAVYSSRKSIAGLSAGLASVTTAFKDYRGNVKERFGEEIDKELRFGVKAKEVEETVVNEDGTEDKINVIVNSVEKIHYSDYARFFGPECKTWTKNPEINLTTVKQVERWANDTIEARSYNPSGIGTMFLNEVYDALGIDRTVAGQEVGWVYYRNGDNPYGDNYIDFGIYDVSNAANRRFVNGSEPTILLDFNVQGSILHMIGGKKKHV